MPKDKKQTNNIPKSKNKAPSSDEDDDHIDESYDSEMDQSDSDGNLPEVNKAHLLNYESDDSDSDVQNGGNSSEDEDDLARGLAKQKEALVMNDTWGSKKRNFYGRDKKAADDQSSSEDDEDERLEALRL